ncbi:MAG: LytTR family DNA-binding domain-containing protein [Polyangiaceae bacterium]
MMLRVAIADDELLARRRLERLLGGMAEVEVVASCASAEELIEAVRGGVELAVIDIRMPGLSGLDAAALLEPRPAIVYVTAHRDHAVEAFDLGAVDYVLKPVDAGRLVKAVARARDKLAEAAARRSSVAIERLALSTHDGVVLVDPATIGHLSLDGELVQVARIGAPAILTELSLRELEAKLPSGFERVHRRHIVNLAQVERLRATEAGGYVAILPTGEVPVSRQHARRLRAALSL